MSLPDGVLQPLHQQFKDDRETLRLSLGNILEGDLAAIEVIDHGNRRHTAVLLGCGLAS
jgi:hypothetical protein